MAAELGDAAELKVSVSRVVNLYRQSRLEIGQFIGVLKEARSRTREYTGSIKKRATGGRRGGKNQFPYFLAIVEDLINVRQGIARDGK